MARLPQVGVEDSWGALGYCTPRHVATLIRTHLHEFFLMEREQQIFEPRDYKGVDRV
jgi:hypothetical protein